MAGVESKKREGSWGGQHPRGSGQDFAFTVDEVKTYCRLGRGDSGFRVGHRL